MIIVMGVPGAGKSTVLSIAQAAGWTVLNYGDLMMEIAKGKGIADRDALRKQPAEFQKEIQKEVGERLAKEKRRTVILDTHCSVNTPGGYLPGLPFSFLSRWSVERLVYITAEPKEIMKRREKDPTRKRNDQDLHQLMEHDQINRAYMAAYSVLTGAPAKIIINADGKVEKTQTEFKALLA
ncbi:Adenylate kinase [uncultured archaeon]|nr:Adenylate kinase [uncultured archaeon]